MKKIISIWFCSFFLSACSQPDGDPKYIYKTIRPEFLPFSDWKKDKDQAIKLAARDMEILVKNECRKTGQGWTLKEVASTGELECEESSDGHRCRRKAIVLDCRQIDMR